MIERLRRFILGTNKPKVEYTAAVRQYKHGDRWWYIEFEKLPNPNRPITKKQGRDYPGSVYADYPSKEEALLVAKWWGFDRITVP